MSYFPVAGHAPGSLAPGHAPGTEYRIHAVVRVLGSCSGNRGSKNMFLFIYLPLTAAAISVPFVLTDDNDNWPFFTFDRTPCGIPI